MLPNFLVIGAPRSGTTSLYEYLNAHPSVYMSPVKEPDFFASPAWDRVYHPDHALSADEQSQRQAALATETDRYTALFDGAGSAAMRGEASAIYLGHPTAAEYIHQTLPGVKLIAVLRNPSERLYSHYVHGSRIRAEWGDQITWDQFTQTVDRAYREGCPEQVVTEPEIWVRSGYYARHLRRWQALFGADQLRIYLFEDLAHDTRGLMRDVFQFLGIDASFSLPTTEAFNASVVPRNMGLFRLFTRRNPVMRLARSVSPTFLRAVALRTRNRALASAKPAADMDMERKSRAIYHDDILELQELLGRDLSAWLDEPSTSNGNGNGNGSA